LALAFNCIALFLLAWLDPEPKQSYHIETATMDGFLGAKTELPHQNSYHASKATIHALHISFTIPRPPFISRNQQHQQLKLTWIDSSEQATFVSSSSASLLTYHSED
jgi:hypothetical protein